mgnify:CR=1 FL=1|jgi:hypothetical protein
MITKEQVKEILTKNPAGITKEELKFVFWHILLINQRI